MPSQGHSQVSIPTPYMSMQIERKLKSQRKKKKSLSWYKSLWYLKSSENLKKEMKKQSGYTTPNNVVRRNAKSKVIKKINRKLEHA